MKSAGWVVVATGLLGVLAGCRPGTEAAPLAVVASGAPAPSGPPKEVQAPVPAPTRAPLGGPIDGLTVAELEAFERGRLVFERRFQPSEGLGPLYNAASCSSCHSTPEVGGSAQLYRNFYVAMSGLPGLQQQLPGLPSLVVPAFGAGGNFSLRRGRTVIPQSVGTQPVTVAQRNAISVFGTGLFEFVSNVTILGLADPNDSDGDGISGRYNSDSTGIGRFGVKAQSNNIELFTRGPLNNQMGITTDPFLGTGAAVSLAFRAAQAGSDPNASTTDADGVPDPELASGDLGDLIAFTRFLAPVGPLLPFSEAARRGKEHFEDIGCTKCHVPALTSTRGAVRAYTDLLLHDMGTELADGIHMGTPQPSILPPSTTEREFRTQPLWGVSLHAPFLHDGRAETLHEAIDLHGGEAQGIRDAYLALPSQDQADLIEFLEHL